MILSSLVYETLVSAIRKDTRGKSLSIDEYNLIAPIVCRYVFDDMYKKFEETIDSSDNMGQFKVFNYSIALTPTTGNTATIGLLPANYYHIIGRPKTISGSTIRWLDIVSTKEHAWRAEDYLTQPSTTHPTCMIGGEDGSGNVYIRANPYTINTIYLDYLRVPDTPYLDWYVNNTTLRYSYLTAGATQNIPSGSTYRDGTNGGVGVNVVSLTTNWEFGTDDLDAIISKFLFVIGLQLRDETLLQASMINETKVKQ